MPSILKSGAASLACLSFLATSASALTSTSYQLSNSYSGSTFFDHWNFFTDADPTNGFVTYVSQSDAASLGLISSGDGSPAYLRVDSTNTYSTSGAGRKSVRISSKDTYTHGLIISDIAHQPGGICGTWPAHWSLGPNWPAGGEFDIIEGANSATNNLMSLHTSPDCTIAGANELGTLETNNCDTTINYNQGCNVLASTSASYGSGFNSIGGGVYATQWTSDYIRVWFFPRGSVPADITAGTPDPSSWGLPQANFEGSCDIDSHFYDHNLIFDTTFCGDYGGSLWSSDATCSGQAATCADFVANNPSAFTNAYWAINSISIYQLVETNGTSTSTFAMPTLGSTSLLSSVTPASSVAAPGMGSSVSLNTSTTVPYKIATVSTPAPTTTNPATIGNWRLVGCIGSSSSFSSFTLVDTSTANTLERCTSECAARNSLYAGIFNNNCFCANSIDSATSLTTPSACNNACPGNANELCGGSVGTSRRDLSKRQASNTILLTLYINSAQGAGVSSGAATATGGVHYGVDVSVNVNVLVSVAPVGAVVGYGMGGGAGAYVTGVVSTTYIDVCAVCAGGYTTVTTTLTYSQCGCVAGISTTTPTIPLTTVTKSCNACASPVVTVTVPVTAVPVASVTGTVIPTVTAVVAATGKSNKTTAITATLTAATQTTGVVVFKGTASAMAANIAAVLAVGMVLALL